MCVRVCVVDERGETLLNTFVKPSAPVTDYRAALTGIDEENAPRLFAGAPSLPEAREMVLAILNPGSREATLCQTVSDDNSDTDCAPLWWWGTTWRTTWLASGSRARAGAPPAGHGALRAVRAPHAQAVQTARFGEGASERGHPVPEPGARPEGGRARGHAPVRGGESAVRAFFTSRRRDARDGARRFVRRRRRARRNEAAAFEKTEKTEPKARFRCWCLDGCLDQTPPPLAPGRLAPSHARSPGSAAERFGVFYKTEATREPKRVARRDQRVKSDQRKKYARRVSCVFR